MAAITYHVQDASGAPIAGALLSAVSVNGNWQGLTGSDGIFKADLAAGHYDVTVSKDGYLSRLDQENLADPGDVFIGLTASGAVSSGLTFPDGWQYRGATDFRIIKRLLDGENVDPVIQQRKAAGANILRALTMAGNLFPLDPDTYSDADFAAAVAHVNGFGLKLELVALADCAKPLTKPLSWQQAHLARVGRIAGMNNLVELGNELNDEYQNVNPMDFSKPAGCLSSRGSITGYGDESLKLPAAPNAWDYSTIHGDRTDGWLQNIAKAGLDLVHGFTGYAGTHNPMVHNEPSRTPYPRTSPEDWFIAGVQCAVWRNDGIGGGAFHCESGLQSLLWNDTELASAERFFAGMTAGTH